MKAIYKRELASYFQTMMGPVFIAVLTAATGVYFAIYNLMSGYPYFAMTLQSTMFILMITVPVVTMKSFAEERRGKSDQCILTASVSIGEIVTGKYFAMVTVFAVPMAMFCICPVLIDMVGEGDYAIDFSAIGSFFLIGCAYISVRMFISSLTESQIIAEAGTFAVLLVFHLWDTILGLLSSSPVVNLCGMIVLVLALAGIGSCLLVMGYLLKPNYFRSSLSYYLGGISFYGSFKDMVANLIPRMEAWASYVSVAAIFCFLTDHRLEKRRWS